MRLRIRPAGAAAASLAALALCAGNAPAVAGARSFDEVYPVASGLCAKASAGTLSKKLAPSTAQVLVACTTLSGDFTQLTATVIAAESTYASTREGEHAKIQAVCPPPAGRVARETCRTVRLTARIADSEALLARHDAAVLYFASLEQNRMAFWATIHSLRGGGAIKGDPPITQPTPAQNPS